MKKWEGKKNWLDENVRIVGVPEGYNPEKSLKGKVVSMESQEEVDLVILEAKVIHSRGGYTTWLDSKCLGFDLVSYPTPGQYEQKYLKRWHKKKASM